MSEDGNNDERDVGTCVAAIAKHPYWTDSEAARSPEITASYLELLTSVLAEAHSWSRALSYWFLRTHCSHDFHMINSSVYECPLATASGNLEEYLKNVERLKRDNPEWKVGGTNFTTALDEGNDSAIVFVTSKGSGGPGMLWDTNRECVSQLFWRRRNQDGVWEAYK